MRLAGKKKKNQGAAMITAIVVGIVVVAFSLSLLLIAYALFSSVAGQNNQLQCKELAKSIQKELRKELMEVSYESYPEQLAAAQDGREENNFWFFLRYNLWQDTWPYYNAGETGHEEADSYRYFTIDASEDAAFEGFSDPILITMYWELESDQPATEIDKSLTVLHVIVETKKGDYSYQMESLYALTVSPYEGDLSDDTTESVSNAVINPDNKAIVTNEKWMWTPD